MTLLDLLTGAWAMAPDKLRELQAIYATHLHGEKIDIAAIEARLGRPLASSQQAYTVERGGVACLTMTGVIAPKANLFMRVSGGMSSQMATLQLESAVADPNVRSIVLCMDSPGGNVIGTPEMAAAVRELAAIKPIVTHSDGTLASAAYWIGSAANAVYLSGPAVPAGSIGVVVDRSYNPASAVRQECIVAGRYKQLNRPHEPLSDEARAVLQADVDYCYSLFVDAVASHRGASVGQVLEHMADGRVFRGQQAVDAGLVDGMCTLAALMDEMAADPGAFAQRRRAVFTATSPPPGTAARAPLGTAARTPPDTVARAPLGTAAAPRQPFPNREKEPVMEQAQPAAEATPQAVALTRAALEREHANLFAQLRSEFTAIGAVQERERIQAVLAVAENLPGHDKLLEQLAFDGKTCAPQASMAVLKAEGEQRAAAIKAHADDAPAPAAASAAPPDTSAKTKAQQVQEAKALAKDKGMPFVAALKELGYA